MDKNKNISEFCGILRTIRDAYGSDIIFDPKRLKAILSDLNPILKDEEKKFMFLVSENQTFVRNVYTQQSVSERAVSREIEDLCGFNQYWTELATDSLLTILGKEKRVGLISFNSKNEHRDFVFAKSRSDEPFRNGPINITNEESFWILIGVHNEAVDINDGGENVRVSAEILNCGDTSYVKCRILCDNANPQVTEAQIEFNSLKQFSLRYCKGSAYMYSSAYGLHSTHKIQLDDDILTAEGTRIGFKERDGKIPGGQNNTVTVSIKLDIMRRNESSISFSLPIEDVFTVTGKGTVAVGKVSDGELSVGDKVDIVSVDGNITESVVSGIEMFRRNLDKTMKGDSVGLLLRGVRKEDIKDSILILNHDAGNVMGKKFRAKIHILLKDEGGRGSPMFDNYKPFYKFPRLDVRGLTVNDDGDKEKMGMIMPGQDTYITVTLDDVIPVVKGMSFTIHEGDGIRVADGVVVET